MTRLIASEFLKLRTTRTFYGLVGFTLGLIYLITVLASALGHHSRSDDVSASPVAAAPAHSMRTLSIGRAEIRQCRMRCHLSGRAGDRSQTAFVPSGWSRCSPSCRWCRCPTR